MENGNGPIMEKNYIARLKAEIAQVLEILKETSWTDVDGSFTKYVIDGLNQLDGAYFECGHQNIPLPQVKQARDDITKAITDAKIIPNICSVLTHLYKGNLELFVGHKYDGISSTATRILCNYGSSAQFANEVANCPGFLEFISELLRDSSEDYMYLQINTQVSNIDLRSQSVRHTIT